jgi:hypothetical protein
MTRAYIEKENNRTRYNTEDLNALLAAVDGSVVIKYEVQNYYGWGTKKEQRTTTPEVGRDLCGAQPLYGWDSGVAYVTDMYLKLKTPKGLLEYPEYQLCMLGALGQQQAVAPNTFVAELVTALIEHSLRGNWQIKRSTGIAQQVQQAATAISHEHQLRVMDRIEAPPEARRGLTPDEKLARLQSDSFYGGGGVLEGPSWAWRSGQRCPTGKWEWRISSAQEYYERELEARTKYIKQIEKLGGAVKLYETFPEYLRRLADEMEARGRFVGAE